MTQHDHGIEIAIDTGGTFTDVVCRRGSDMRVMKVPSTKGDPSLAVKESLDILVRDWDVAPDAVARFIHGTTIATNAVLERKGARIGILTTEGFKDVLELGRQMRHAMYDLRLQPETPVFLAPGARRAEVRERVSAQGEVLTPLDPDSLRAAVEQLISEKVDAIAICFLFSFVHPEHELQARDFIERHYPEVMTSLSCEVDPSFREYERTCITAFDAYVKPIVEGYLRNMEGHLATAQVPAPLQVMQSRGGLAVSGIARQRPVRLFLSGPAAGVVGSLAAGAACDLRDLITLDVGGTSSDIALIAQGTPLIRTEGEIGGYGVRVPMIDVNALGAGGGSVAWLDSAAGLRVGPHSAGSEPGPACYDKGGEEPTVTDASVVLGYLNPEAFAGGAIRLRPERAREAIEQRIAEPMGLSVEDAALGIHRVVNAQMAEGIRLVSIKRGHDPRGFVLVALGGAGPLHAAPLAQALGITRVLVPRNPGVLSAAGLLAAPIEHEVALAFPHNLADVTLAEVRPLLDQLDARARDLMAAEAVAAGTVRIAYFADVCYVGQSYPLEVPFDPAAPDALDRLYEDFLAIHDRVHGHSTRNPAKFINLRSVHEAGGGGLALNGATPPSGRASQTGSRTIRIDGVEAPVDAAVYDRHTLPLDFTVDGPAIFEQADTTVLLPPGWTASVADGGNLLLTRH